VTLIKPRLLNLLGYVSIKVISLYKALAQFLSCGMDNDNVPKNCDIIKN